MSTAVESFPCPTCSKPSIGVSMVYDGRQSRQCRSGHFFGISGYIPSDAKKIFGQCKVDEIRGIVVSPTTSHLRGAHNQEKDKAMQTNNASDNVKQPSAIERALAAAKARKAAKIAAHSEESGSLVQEDDAPAPKAKAPKAPKVKVEKPTDDARAAAKADRDAKRAQRQAARAQKEAALAVDRATKKEARLAKKAEKAAAREAAKAGRTPAHMKKVEKARSKCPPLNDSAQVVFGDITANFSADQIDALAQHLLVHNRAMATVRACQSTQLPLGSTVRITGGDRRYLGMTGEVVHSQKLRAMVKVSGVSKPVYIYSCDAVVTAEPASATA